MSVSDFFAWSPVRRLMKNQGAEIVARDAVDRLIIHLEKISKELTRNALSYAHHAGRKKITVGDIELAIKYL